MMKIKALIKKPEMLRVVKFLVTGTLNTVTYLLILTLLSKLTGIEKGLEIYVLSGIAFFVAVIQSYFINSKWTFKDRKNNEEKKGEKAFIYFLITFLGQVINSTIVYLLTKHICFSEPKIISEYWITISGAIATSVSMVWNFLGYKLFVFKDNK